jgi:hypothetical protein
VAQQIEAGKCGRTYNADDRASIVAAINSMAADRETLKQYQRNALTYGRDWFNWEILSAPLRTILAKLSADGRS